jgi:predicted nucleotidyltransferase
LTVEELIRQMRALAEKADVTIGNTRWYLFGSAICDPVRAADVDLLVVCRDPSDADAIRRTAGELVFYKPVDLSILTEDEETEVSFVANQRCVRVFPACG